MIIILKMEDHEREEVRRLYDIIMDELEIARGEYSEAAVRVTQLTEVANSLRNLLDS